MIRNKLVWKNKREELFGIDIRSLALFRMGLALLMLIDLANRAGNLEQHYGPLGVLPQETLMEYGNRTWHWSAYFWSQDSFYTGSLFLLHACCALSMLVGFRTRTATILCWFFLVSLHNRNPLLLQGGDALLRMMLFWAIFLPLGACWSLDQKRKGIPDYSRRAFSAATAAALLQVVFMYWITAVVKGHGIWRSDGTAIEYALNLGQFTTPLGIWLSGYPELLKALSFFTIYLEDYGTLLAFFPFGIGLIRMILLFLFSGLHLSIAATMELGLFSYIVLVAWTVYLPSAFWNKIGQNILFRKLYLRHKTGQDAFPGRVRTSGGSEINTNTNQERKDNDKKSPQTITINILVSFLLLYVFLWNLRLLDFEKYRPWFPSEINPLAYTLRLDQGWTMFSPHPPRQTGWFVIEGNLSDGKKIDLLQQGSPLSWEKPELVSAIFPNQRWRKYIMNLTLPSHQVYRESYGNFLCNQWNGNHRNPSLQKGKFYFMKHLTLLNQNKSIPRKSLLYKFTCT